MSRLLISSIPGFLEVAVLRSVRLVLLVLRHACRPRRIADLQSRPLRELSPPLLSIRAHRGAGEGGFVRSLGLGTTTSVTVVWASTRFGRDLASASVPYNRDSNAAGSYWQQWCGNVVVWGRDRSPLQIACESPSPPFYFAVFCRGSRRTSLLFDRRSTGEANRLRFAQRSLEERGWIRRFLGGLSMKELITEIGVRPVLKKSH